MIQKCFEYQSNKTIRWIGLRENVNRKPPWSSWENPWFPVKIIPSNQPSPRPSSRTFLFFINFQMSCSWVSERDGYRQRAGSTGTRYDMPWHAASVSIIKNHNVVNAIATHEQFTQYSDTQKLEVELLRKHDKQKLQLAIL